jgi:hypothetical protein
MRHVFTQLVLINIAVLRQTRAELIQRVAFFAPRPAIILRVSFSISASLAALNHASACCCSSAV